MVSVQFYSDGQIEISCGKEDVNYKKSWEHEWLMGNNQVLKRHKQFMGNGKFEKSPSKLELFWFG